MNNLYFNVVKQKITLDNCCRDTIVASKARKYVVANFKFDDEDWQNKEVTAIFKNSHIKDAYTQIIGKESELESNECYIPWEVLEYRGILSVSVFAGDLQTTIPACVNVFDSGYIGGKTPSEPTQTVYQQILKELKIIEEQGVPEEVLESAVKKYLEEHPIEIDTYTKSQIDNKISTAVEEIRKIIPAPYDDTEIKETISQLNESIADIQAELVGVNELANNLYDLTNEIGEVIGNDEY